MSCLEALDNPLGFNRQIAALVTGLGCTNLNKFKKKNISLDDLKQLTEEDLRVLEVGDDFDFESYKKLSANLIRKYDTTCKRSSQDIIKILNSGRRQLQVLIIYLKYIHLQLRKNKIDFFLDKNNNLRFSRALVNASDCVLSEIKSLEEALCVIEPNKPKESSKKFKYCTFILGGIGIITVAYILY